MTPAVWPWFFAAAGVVSLLLLRPIRNSYRGWAKERYATRVVFGYVLPLVGLASVFLGLGMLWQPDAPQAPFSVALLVCFLLGLGCLAASLAAIWGLPMPRILLPRWLRADPELLNSYLGDGSKSTVGHTNGA